MLANNPMRMGGCLAEVAVMGAEAAVGILHRPTRLVQAFAAAPARRGAHGNIPL